MNIDLNKSKKHPLYKNAFQSMFKTLQLCSAYVLFYDLDWSREAVIEYQGVFEKVDNDIKAGKLTEHEMMNYTRNKINFECVKENNSLSYRVKTKMCKVKYKPKMVATFGIAIDDSSGTHLNYATYILVKYYDFDEDAIRNWYSHLIEFCKLYETGLTDDHVLEYFEKIGDIKITEG